jgi:hypothetical protein
LPPLDLAYEFATTKGTIGFPDQQGADGVFPQDGVKEPTDLFFSPNKRTLNIRQPKAAVFLNVVEKTHNLSDGLCGGREKGDRASAGFPRAYGQIAEMRTKDGSGNPCDEWFRLNEIDKEQRHKGDRPYHCDICGAAIPIGHEELRENDVELYNYCGECDTPGEFAEEAK